MNYWLFIIGLLICGFVFTDALWTTLWPEGGAGPITDRIGTWMWTVFKKLAGVGQEMSHRFLSTAGPLVILVTVVTWMVLLWVGLVMVFSSYPDAVVVALTKEPADLSARIWYVLYTTTTVGNGGFAPNTGFFEVLSGIVAASGMALLTLGITYTLQILGAVVDKRTFAGEALSLGKTTAEVVVTLQSADATAIAAQFSSLASRLGSVTEQHKAYPILHYFHPTDRDRSTACAVAVLDEALRVYVSGLDQSEAPMQVGIIEPMRSSIATFLEALIESYLDQADEAPPDLDIDQLRRQGADVKNPDKLRECNEQQTDRRKLLAGLVAYDGWKWDDVIHGA